jgi:cytochrome c oxidase assembly protein subunit 15
MDGHWIPEVIFMQEPLWRNFFENIATVQFQHRLLAMLVFLSIILLWLDARRVTLPAAVTTGLLLMLAAVVLQVSLGISTLLLHVPVPLAATHQAGALLLFTIVLYTRYRMSRTTQGS